MARNKILNLQLRGNVVDVVQHHNWLLIAAEHSEGQNLGIQFAPIRNILNRVRTERWIFETPKPIQKFASLPNKAKPDMYFTIDELRLDGATVGSALQRRNEIKRAFELKAQSNPDTEIDIDQKMALIRKELQDLIPPQENTLVKPTLRHLATALMDFNHRETLKKAFKKADSDHRFSSEFQQGQRIVCVDIDGQGYHMPYIPAEKDFEGQTEALKLTPFSFTDKIEFIEPLQHHLLMLVVRAEDDSQWVCTYNLDTNAIIFKIPAPQPHITEDSLREDAEDELFASTRTITALATSIGDNRFALGFNDGLYLWFDCTQITQSGIEFERQELRNMNKSVLTSVGIKELVQHTGAIVGLAFSQDYNDNTPRLTAFCDDLTTSRILLRENMPKAIATSSKRGHSKKVKQVMTGPGHLFYTLSIDNTIRMWKTPEDASISLPLSAECITTICVPVQDRKTGEWSYSDILVAGHDGTTVSGHSKLDSAALTFRLIDMHDMGKRTGEVKESVQRSFYGVWTYALKEMTKEPQKRETLLEYIGTLEDQLAIDLLLAFVHQEENPVFIRRALELLNASQHPRLIVLFTELMTINRAATCLQVLEYLRMPHLYGQESLYPLELANKSSFLELRQAALRGFADLASRRGESENTVFQMAFEQVLALFNTDAEEDIVANAFEFLFAQAEALMPGIEGILMTLAHPQFWVQRRGLKLLYFKGMIDNPDTKQTALDLLRQMRESTNEALRILAFRLSLFGEHGVQLYLRSLDDVLHSQLSDLETEKRLSRGEGVRPHEKEWKLVYADFEIDSTVEQIFLNTISSDDNETQIDMTEAQKLVSDLKTVLTDSKSTDIQHWCQQLHTMSYCIQTFQMSEEIQRFLLASRSEFEYPPPQLDRELSKAEKVLLQEMALSYQPSIAALGAMALAKQGENAALPILLQLVDDKDDLVKSRSVDGLLEFIHEPIVEHKLRILVLQADNVQVKRNSRDKASEIQALVQQNRFQITQRMVHQIVNLIFEDEVYSHSERLCIRYLFESTEITFSSHTRIDLFKSIRERGERPKLINIRSKVLRALYKKATITGDEAIQNLLSLTLESPFDDVRMLAVVRLQQRIQEKLDADEGWPNWPRFTSKTWGEWVKANGGGLISASDIDNLAVKSPVNPLVPLVGIPEPLRIEVQLLNRVLFWHGHEAIHEWIKVYIQYNLINGDFIDTRQFLLSLPVKDIFEFLLKEINRNVQDTMIKGDPKAERWHDEMWMDYLNHPQESKWQWGTLFYNKIDATMRQPRTPSEKKAVEEGTVIPPFVPFIQSAFKSEHKSLQHRAFSQIIHFFDQAWVAKYIWEALESDDAYLRKEATTKRGLWILHTNDVLKDALLYMLASKHEDLFLKALKTLFYSTDTDIQSWTEGMIDASVIEALLSRMNEVWSTLSWVDAAFIHTHFISQTLFNKIPKPSLFGKNFEQLYFNILQKVFVYETLEDIDAELKAYTDKKDALQLHLRNIKHIKKTFRNDPDALKVELKRFLSQLSSDQTALKESSVPEMSDAIETIATLSQTETILIQELKLMEGQAPKPRQDLRFFDALKLLSIAKGTWADDLLNQLMSTFDEKLSNEAFHVYFARGIKGSNPEAFLTSMIHDTHPRLDDVFAMLLSQRYGSPQKMANVWMACTRLSRIDLVFKAFETLASSDLVELDSWEALLLSKHRYLRHRSLKYFLTHKSETVRINALRRYHADIVKEKCPSSLSSIVSLVDIDTVLDTKDDATVSNDFTLHAFIKNARSLKFRQLEGLRKHFPMSPGFIRNILNSDTHILASDLTYEGAKDLHHLCTELGITIIFSQSNPLYDAETQSLWQSNVSNALRYIHDERWLTDEELANDLLDLDAHVQKHLGKSASLRQSILEALGSIAGPSNFERMYAYLNGRYSDTVATALVRSGNVQGLRTLFPNHHNAVIAMMTLGSDANLFIERTILGALGADQQQKTIQMWLMRHAQVGGKSDLMMTMLNGSHAQMLLASQLFGFMHEQSRFEHRVIELLKLEKIALTPIPSEVNFHSVTHWKSAMTKMKTAYVNHYCVEPDGSRAVVLADLHKANSELQLAQSNLKTMKQSNSNKKALKNAQSAVDKANTQLNTVKDALSKCYVTIEEWKWFARHLVSDNSRINYLVSEWISMLLDGSKNRKQLLEAQAHIEELCSKNEVSFHDFTPMSLNGMELNTESAVSFGFGSLSGIVRNHRNVSVHIRRKAFASLIQLAEDHHIPTVSAVLSVALNDPSKQVRRDAFVLALNHQESLGLSSKVILRQAINAVSLRNAEQEAAGSSDTDPLNQLIVSELQRTAQFEMLLDMIRTQPHALGFVALELLLDVEQAELAQAQKTILSALSAALQSPNKTIRNQLIQRIGSELNEVLAYNQTLLDAKGNLEYLNDDPYWDLLAQCLHHGVTHIAAAAAEKLIANAKCLDDVLAYVYTTWLNAFEKSLQRKACHALEQLRPHNATEKLLDRVYVNDLTETADITMIQKSLTTLNQYTPEIASQLLKAIDARHSKARFSSNPNDPAFKLAYQLLLRYTGLSASGTQSIYRVDLVCKLIKILRANSHFHLLSTLLNMLTRLPPRTFLSADLDEELSELATTLRHAQRLDLRKQALKICIDRYMMMTPFLKHLPVSEHQKTPVLSAEWSTSGWAHLKDALLKNLDFHEKESHRKEYLSDFQKLSAMALISTQGYTHDVFKVVRTILEDSQYNIQERSNALECLVITESASLLGPLQRLIGLGTDQNRSESEVLDQQKVHPVLYERALSLIGRYHDTERGTNIFYYLIERLQSTAASRRPAVLTSLWYFKEKLEHQAHLLDALVNCRTVNRAAWWSTPVDIPGGRDGLIAIHLWQDLLIELYEYTFSIDIPPLRAEAAQKARTVILQHIETTDLNRIYEFYLAFCANSSIDLDLKLWKSDIHLFLTPKNRNTLRSRLEKHGDQKLWIDLMLQGIRAAAAQKKARPSIDNLFGDAIAKRQKRLEVYPGQEATFLSEDIRALKNHFDSRKSPPTIEVELFFQALFKHRDELSSEVIDWVIGLYHQNQRGDFFIFTQNQFEAMDSLDWQTEVDLWETAISRHVTGIQFYLDLLNQYLPHGGMIFESVIDILKQRTFSSEEQKLLLGMIMTLRQEWNVLQRERRKGVQNQKETQLLETCWLNSLQIIPLFNDVGEELTQILMLENTPLELKRAALDHYLQRKTDADILTHIYQSYPSLKSKVAHLLNLEMLHRVLIDSADALNDFKESLEQWMKRLDIVLDETSSLTDLQWIAQNLLSIGDVDTTKTHPFIDVLQSNKITGVQEYLKDDTNRHHIRRAIVFRIICDTIEQRRPLTSMYWATIEQGRLLNAVVQYLIVQETFSEKTLDSFLILALSGAEDPDVRKPYEKRVPIYAKHRARIDKLQQTRSQRYRKELP